MLIVDRTETSGGCRIIFKTKSKGWIQFSVCSCVLEWFRQWQKGVYKKGKRILWVTREWTFIVLSPRFLVSEYSLNLRVLSLEFRQVVWHSGNNTEIAIKNLGSNNTSVWLVVWYLMSFHFLGTLRYKEKWWMAPSSS